MNFFIAIIAFSLYTSATGAGYSAPVKPSSVTPAAITPLDVLYNYYMQARRALLTSTTPDSPALPPPLASLCLDYVQGTHPMFPGIIQQVARIEFPTRTIVLRTTVTSNGRIIATTLTSGDENNLTVYEISSTTYALSLVKKIPITELPSGFNIADAPYMIASNGAHYIMYYGATSSDGVGQHWLLNTTTNTITTITNHLIHPIFSPDSSQLFFTDQDGKLKAIDLATKIVNTPQESDYYNKLIASNADAQCIIETPTGLSIIDLSDISRNSLRIPGAINAHYIPDQNILVCQSHRVSLGHSAPKSEAQPSSPLGRVTHARSNLSSSSSTSHEVCPNYNRIIQEIIIFKIDMSTADLLTKLDSETIHHLYEMVNRHNTNRCCGRLRISNSAEHMALEKLKDISPTLYANFVAWCDIVPMLKTRRGSNSSLFGHE